MLRGIGCLLILCGTCFLAGTAVKKGKQRVVMLRDLIDGLEKLGRELSFRLTPLPELLRMIGRELEGPVGTFFLNCGVAVTKGDAPMREIWEKEGQTLQGYLSEQPLDVFLRIGRFLGRSDWQEESAYLVAAVHQLKEILKEEQTELSRRGQLYRTLGPAAGGILILLLL